MLQFPIMTAQEIALDAAFALLPITLLECCFILFHDEFKFSSLKTSEDTFTKFNFRKAFWLVSAK